MANSKVSALRKQYEKEKIELIVRMLLEEEDTKAVLDREEPWIRTQELISAVVEVIARLRRSSQEQCKNALQGN